jgi:hypothetical protein
LLAANFPAASSFLLANSANKPGNTTTSPSFNLTFMTATFSWLDYTIFGVYLAASVSVGLLSARGSKSLGDYFLAGSRHEQHPRRHVDPGGPVLRHQLPRRTGGCV